MINQLKFKLYFVLCLAVSSYGLSSCNQKNDLKEHFPEKYLAKSNISINNIALDSVLLRGFNSSFTGQVKIYDDTICFVDSRFGNVFLFNRDGVFQKTVLGQGPGPKEIDTKYIDGAYIDRDMKTFFGSSFDVYSYNSNWEKTKSYVVNWKWKKNNINAINEPDASERALYTFDWEKLVIKKHGGFFYVPIYSQHRNFNGFSSKRYFEESPILAKIDVSSGVVTELLGRRSPKYLEHDLLGQFPYISFDINNKGEFLIGYEIDPKIYLYDSKYKGLYAFGLPGKDIDTAYTDFKINGDPNEKSNMKLLQQRYYADRAKFGYYSDLYSSPDGGLVFRAYEKGKKQPDAGLQIYRDHILIGDVSVPKNFKMIGYIMPFYYGYCGTNEEKELIKLYKFSLK